MESGLAPARVLNPITRSRVTAAESMAKFREIGLRSMAKMYSAKDGIFHFRVRRATDSVAPEGISHRYTAISLIGLASQSADVISLVLGGHSLEHVCKNIVELSTSSQNLGDVALTCWAAQASGFTQSDAAWKRLLELKPESATHPTVEVSWALAAMCVDPNRVPSELRDAVAARLMNGLNRPTGVNPHVLGSASRHVACFADQVYPIHALSLYSALTGKKEALHDAARCADMICRLQGEAGQWWWHYDIRSGKIIEGYPVYAIHQDAMGPMALFALRNAGGPDFIESINRGVSWLVSSPELKGGTLVDGNADIIWRKVARREPNKLSRYLQAGASRLHSSVRVPGVNALFPPLTIDFEDRPYHIGWMLYAIELAGKTWQIE